MGEVAPGRDAEFLFDAPADAMVSVGVASKSGEARVSVYDAGKDEAYPGTEREAGAIRWVGSMTSGEKLSIVVHTQGQETPVRVEVSLDPTSAR